MSLAPPPLTSTACTANSSGGSAACTANSTGHHKQHNKTENRLSADYILQVKHIYQILINK